MYPVSKTEQDPLLAYKVYVDPDTMYMHQVVKEPDRDQFIAAMQKEVRDQSDNGNCLVIKQTDIPKGATTLPTVWQMRRKHNIKTRKVKKWKARLNIDESRMKKGVHFKETYTPVASWNLIRMLLTLTAVHDWHTKQLNYVLAFPQAPVENGRVLRWLGRYLKATRDKGTILKPCHDKDMEIYVDTNFAGNWDAAETWDRDTARSCHSIQKQKMINSNSSTYAPLRKNPTSNSNGYCNDRK
jgi:hypothetical protein